MEFLGIFVTIVQALVAGFAVYSLMRATRGIKAIGEATTSDGLGAAWRGQVLWSVFALVSLFMSGVFMDATLSVFVFLIIVSMIWVIAGVLVFRLRARAIARGAVYAAQQAAPGADGRQLKQVVVKYLHPDRVRSVDASNQKVIFTADELRDFKGTTGEVEMLNVGTAMSMVGGAACVPIMGFRNSEGEAFLLYRDDHVIPA